MTDSPRGEGLELEIHSLGTDRFFSWITWEGRAVGLHERHAREKIPDGCLGGGYIAWEKTPVTPVANHELVSGGPGDEAHLTISPSLWHRGTAGEGNALNQDTCHGFIRDGRWVRVDGTAPDEPKDSE